MAIIDNGFDQELDRLQQSLDRQQASLIREFTVLESVLRQLQTKIQCIGLDHAVLNV